MDSNDGQLSGFTCFKRLIEQAFTLLESTKSFNKNLMTSLLKT